MHVEASPDVLELGAAGRGGRPHLGSRDAIMSMLVCVVGGGLLTMPGFYLETGVVASTLFTLQLLVALYFSVDLLSVASMETGQRSYEGIAFSLFGWPGLWAVELCLFTLQFGTVCGYLVTLGELFEPICGSRALALLLAATVLGINRDDNTLSHYVSWSRACVVLYVLTVVLLAFGAAWAPLPNVAPPSISVNGTDIPVIVAHPIVFTVAEPLSVLRSLPVMFQAYTFQSSFFSMIGEVKEPSMAVSVTITKKALLLASVFYSTVGVLGVVALGTQPDADILQAVTGDLVLYDVLRAMVAVMVALAFPMVYVPCRRTLDRLLFLGYGGLGDDDSPAPTSASPIPSNRLFVNSILVLLVAVLVTLRVSSLERVLMLTGSSAGIIVSLTLPAIFYLRTARLSDRRMTAAMALLFISFVLFVSCFFAVVSTPSDVVAVAPRPTNLQIHNGPFMF